MTIRPANVQPDVVFDVQTVAVALDADVLVLQEVWWPTDRPGFIEELAADHYAMHALHEHPLARDIRVALGKEEILVLELAVPEGSLNLPDGGGMVHGSARLFGYNDAPSRGLVGPGYFVAHDTASEPAWQERGAVVVDYFLVPDAPVAEGWPAVKQNHEGLQRWVYFHTRDFMRRVADGVTIGAAYKEDKALDHYFVLVRQ